MVNCFKIWGGWVDKTLIYLSSSLSKALFISVPHCATILMNFDIYIYIKILIYIYIYNGSSDPWIYDAMSVYILKRKKVHNTWNCGNNFPSFFANNLFLSFFSCWYTSSYVNAIIFAFSKRKNSVISMLIYHLYFHLNKDHLS